MLRTLKVLFLLCVTAACAAAAPPKKNPDVERAVKAELAGKTFTTKFLLGSYIPCPDPNLNRNDAIKLIDTELSLDSSIRYLATNGCNYPGGFIIDFLKGYYVGESFAGSLQPGTTVWVRRVSFMADRVEVILSANNNDSAEGYGKIKYMLGTEYRTWSADKLMEAISRGIVIPTYEKLASLKAEFETLRFKLQEAERKFNTSRDAPASKPDPNGIERNLLKKVPLVYPPIAKAARVQGTVVLDVLVGKDGSVESATVVSGPFLLSQAAIDAVKQWKYRPMLVDGAAIEVKSKVSLAFTLGETQLPWQKQESTAHDVLADAISLRQVIEELQKNRAEFTAMGKSDPDAGVYSEKLNALLPEVARLTERAHIGRVADVRDQLQGQLPQLSEIQSQIRQKPPSSMAEWQQRSDSLARYSTLLDERQNLLDGLRNENEPPSPEDVKYMSDSKAEIETAKSALEHGRQQLELTDLTTQFAQLTKRRAQLLDVYSRVFGTPKERVALQDLSSVLGQMMTNRDRASGLGDKTAPAQLIKCRAEADKYKRK